MAGDKSAPDFYKLRYAAEAEALQNKVFAEADPGYFGQGSWTSRHREAIIALEGPERIEALTAYRRMAETLAIERRLSHVAFVALRRK